MKARDFYDELKPDNEKVVKIYNHTKFNPFDALKQLNERSKYTHFKPNNEPNLSEFDKKGIPKHEKQFRMSEDPLAFKKVNIPRFDLHQVKPLGLDDFNRKYKPQVNWLSQNNDVLYYLNRRQNKSLKTDLLDNAVKPYAAFTDMYAKEIIGDYEEDFEEEDDFDESTDTVPQAAGLTRIKERRNSLGESSASDKNMHIDIPGVKVERITESHEEAKSDDTKNISMAKVEEEPVYAAEEIQSAEEQEQVSWLDSDTSHLTSIFENSKTQGLDKDYYVIEHTIDEFYSDLYNKYKRGIAFENLEEDDKKTIQDILNIYSTPFDYMKEGDNDISKRRWSDLIVSLLDENYDYYRGLKREALRAAEEKKQSDEVAEKNAKFNADEDAYLEKRKQDLENEKQKEEDEKNRRRKTSHEEWEEEQRIQNERYEINKKIEKEEDENAKANPQTPEGYYTKTLNELERMKRHGLFRNTEENVENVENLKPILGKYPSDIRKDKIDNEDKEKLTNIVKITREKYDKLPIDMTIGDFIKLQINGLGFKKRGEGEALQSPSKSSGSPTKTPPTPTRAAPPTPTRAAPAPGSATKQGGHIPSAPTVALIREGESRIINKDQTENRTLKPQGRNVDVLNTGRK